jgi:hypothetical protein
MPVMEELIRIRVTRYYIIYSIPRLEGRPDDAAVDDLTSRTEAFWNGFFEEKYADTETMYRGIQITPARIIQEGDEAASSVELLDGNFNYYIEFNTTILYELESTGQLSAGQTFNTMAEDSDFVEYILDFVRKVAGFGFSSTNEVKFKAWEELVEGTFAATEEPQRAGTITEETQPATITRPEDNKALSEASQQGTEEPKGRSPPIASIAAAGSAFLAFAMVGLVISRRRKSGKREDFGKTMMKAATFEDTVTDETSQGSSYKSIGFSRRTGPYPSELAS